MNWVRNEIADGLQALLSLRLKNTPAEDMIELTADIWVQAFSQRVSVEALDAHRIRDGFRQIFPKVREWPAPFDVIELMPNRPVQRALPPPEPTIEEHRENVKRVRGLVNGLIDKLYVTVKKEEKHERLDDTGRVA